MKTTKVLKMAARLNRAAKPLFVTLTTETKLAVHIGPSETMPSKIITLTIEGEVYAITRKDARDIAEILRTLAAMGTP